MCASHFPWSTVPLPIKFFNFHHPRAPQTICSYESLTLPHSLLPAPLRKSLSCSLHSSSRAASFPFLPFLPFLLGLLTLLDYILASTTLHVHIIPYHFVWCHHPRLLLSHPPPHLIANLCTTTVPFLTPTPIYQFIHLQRTKRLIHRTHLISRHLFQSLPATSAASSPTTQLLFIPIPC